MSSSVLGGSQGFQVNDLITLRYCSADKICNRLMQNELPVNKPTIIIYMTLVRITHKKRDWHAPIHLVPHSLEMGIHGLRAIALI